jgi:hypothetical protein
MLYASLDASSRDDYFMLFGRATFGKTPSVTIEFSLSYLMYSKAHSKLQIVTSSWFYLDLRVKF